MTKQIPRPPRFQRGIQATTRADPEHADFAARPSPVANALQLEQAYRETEYRVYAQAQGKTQEVAFFALRVGQVSKSLQKLHKASGVACSAFITACNTHSRQLSDAENVQRMSDFLDVLRARNLQVFPGVWQHPANGWPGEPSYLVMGLSLEAARVLASAFEQNAFVWSGEDAAPRLVFSA